MRTAYPLKIDKETMAYASGVNMGISTKVAIEISNMLRGMALGKAKARLERIIAMKEAVPYRRFNKDVGHKPGIGPGRYPIKACGEVLKLLKSAEANAVDKGLAEEALTIFHINANRAASQFRFGRQSRRKMKRTHLQIVLAEDEKLKSDKKAKKPEQKTEAKKPETKAAPKKDTASQKMDVKAEEKKPVKEAKAEDKTVEKAEVKKPVKEVQAEKKPVEKAEEKKPVQDKPKPEEARPESKDIKESQKKEEKKAPKSPSQ